MLEWSARWNKLNLYGGSFFQVCIYYHSSQVACGKGNSLREALDVALDELVKSASHAVERQLLTECGSLLAK